MADYTTAGEYKLVSMKITDVFGNERSVSVDMTSRPSDSSTMEIKFLVHKFTISESTKFNALVGNVHVLDGVGLFYTFPLRAEEILEVEIEDWFGEIRREKFMVHAITNFRPASQTDNSLLEYQLELVSWGGWIAATHAIRRAYTDSIAATVENIYKDYFLKGPRKPDGSNVDGTDKDLIVEDTVGQQQLIVPFYNGLETMNFLARNAYGNETSGYQFFERSDGFYFCTDEYLMSESYEDSQEIPAFSFQNGPDVDPGAADLAKMQGILSFSINRPFDTLSHLTDGTYYKEIRELDAQQRKVDVTEYKYYDHYNKYYQFLLDGADLKPSNTEEFARTFFKNGKRFLLIKDYPSMGEPSAPMVREQPFRNESIQHSWAVNQHNTANALLVKIYGRHEIRPGDQIRVDLPQLKNAGTNIELDRERSGYYLVETVVNVYEGDTFTQELTLTRGGVIR